MRGRLVEQQGLAEAGRKQRMPVADATADLDPPPARDLVQVERPIALEHSEVHGVASQFGQRLQLGMGNARHVELLPRRKPEFEQLGPQHVAAFRQQPQITAIGECRCQPMHGAAVEAEPGRELRQRQRLLAHGIDHVEPAQQGLASSRAAGDELG